MPAIPTPPADASGGFMLMEYNSGSDTHRMRLHVAPFNYGTGINFAYNPVVGAGTEAGIADTFTNFGNVWRAFYPAASTINLISVFQIVAGLPVERFGWPIPSGVAGTTAAGVGTNQDRAGFFSFNMKSVNGGRAKLFLFNPHGAAPFTGPKVTIAAAGASFVALLNYLSGANSAARCHDGATFAPSGNVTQGYNERLRRAYGFA